ncbi:ATP phosphoribosyltransferase regulatory subunit [Rhodobacteraceae bacterium MBR-64]|jgi:ATP phosphoribosyltransferase regulatory subunit
MTVSRAQERAEAARIVGVFEAAGAVPVEADILQPAGTLLDLYGEDIRARAYVTQDPLLGEMMLRPDFTVPVVEMHMANGAAPARYAYMGEVFRRQEEETGRAREYVQAGYELFAEDAEEADAEVFALFADLLAGRGLQATTGDIGILTAAVSCLQTSEARKAALMRHIWRPARFRALLTRYSAAAPSPARRALLEDVAARGASAVIGAAGQATGLRSEAEIAARLDALAKDAGLPPIAAGEVAVLERLLNLSAPAPEALVELNAIADEMPALRPAVARMARRIDALAARGVAVDALPVELGHGRSSMEYYDGFVFSFLAPDRAGWPPVATGGRYDALTARLGRGRGMRAVGGVVRPGLLLALGA